MKLTLHNGQASPEPVLITVPGSKSESNRLLILQASYPNLVIENLSDSDDTRLLQKALQQDSGIIDIQHAGTAMRFLTAYFAASSGKEVILTGSERMQQRPIKILVDALRFLGAEISYTKNTGFPPLQISGKMLKKRVVSVKANVSSQYISALMLIAPALPEGLTLHLKGRAASKPYIWMTLSLLKKIGIACSFSENVIEIKAAESIRDIKLAVASDWSAASCFYSLVALSEGLSVTLKSFRRDSLQGDAALATLYKALGVTTTFNDSEASITLSKNNTSLPEAIEYSLEDTPDIAQAVSVTCFGLGIPCTLTGLHTLKIKETDRLQALKTELEKLGAAVWITEDSIQITPSEGIKENSTITTYNDHRMAMAFAPLAQLVPIAIDSPEVVSKSYPGFWEALRKAGIGATSEI